MAEPSSQGDDEPEGQQPHEDSEVELVVDGLQAVERAARARKAKLDKCPGSTGGLARASAQLGA